MTTHTHTHPAPGWKQAKEAFLEKCTACGLCVQTCPILPLTDLAERKPQEIQKRVLEFLETGEKNQEAYIRAFACMECFKCTVDTCPQGLNPMTINEHIKGAFSAVQCTGPIPDPGDPDSPQHILAALQLSPDDYLRVTTPTPIRNARVLFFPGCNVYFQPDKILKALDILQMMGEDYAFLPGLTNCCGDYAFYHGDGQLGSQREQDLINAFSSFNPELVVLWCPTCLCRIKQVVSQQIHVDFEISSFPQYLATTMNPSRLSNTAAGVVTLHEACKSAYTGLDPDGARNLLHMLPGVELREMEHHGQDTLCCGSGAVTWFPEAEKRMRQKRLAEARETGAEELVTVCHYCRQAFLPAENDRMIISNYIDLAAAALGINHPDHFRTFSHTDDPERILQDFEERLEDLPFNRDQALAVLRNLFEN